MLRNEFGDIEIETTKERAEQKSEIDTNYELNFSPMDCFNHFLNTCKDLECLNLS